MLGLVAVAAAGAAVAIVPVGASTPPPTKVGVATESGAGFVVGPGLFVQAIDPAVASYAIPPGGGVITRWSFQIAGSSNTPGMTLNVIHQGASSSSGVYTDTVDGTDVENSPSVGPAEVISYPARLAVAAGDRIGVFVPNSVTFEAKASSDSGLVVVARTTQPAQGGTFTTADENPGTHSHLELSADVEPDADHDVFGDFTQDTCPLDPARQAPPCAADLAASASATPATVASGGVALIVAHASVVSGQATNGRLVLTVPPGLTLVSAAGSDGDCTGTTTLTCPVGDLAPATSGLAVAVVQAAAPGSFPVAVAAAADGADANAANNSAAATLTVSSASAANTPSVIKQCTVPPLKGLSETKAKSLLKTFGCTTGKVTKRKIKKAKRGHAKPKRVVITFSPRLGTRAALGTKVKLTLGAVKK